MTTNNECSRHLSTRIHSEKGRITLDFTYVPFGPSGISRRALSGNCPLPPCEPDIRNYGVACSSHASGTNDLKGLACFQPLSASQKSELGHELGNKPGLEGIACRRYLGFPSYRC
jgi:hypothetical protein